MTNMRERDALWHAINRYVSACGGDPSQYVYGNMVRQQAVADVEALLAAPAEWPDAGALVRSVAEASRVAGQALADDAAHREALRAAFWSRLGQLQMHPPPRTALLIADEACELEYLLTGDTEALSPVLDLLEGALGDTDDDQRGDRIEAARERLQHSVPTW